MRIALAQINPIVGDLRGNANKILAFCQKAYARAADLVVFPELSLVGYPPHDLLEHSTFVEAEARARTALARKIPRALGLIVGGLAANTHRPGKPLHNAAFLYEGGQLLGSAHKALLPTYDVFDERRHFEPGARRAVVRWRGRALGLHICEDLWNTKPSTHTYYNANPVAELAADGADLFVNICASPFAVGKRTSREALIAHSVRRHGIPYVFVNQVGANTELIFDGSSCVYSASGQPLLHMNGFEESLALWDSEAPASSVAVPSENATGSLHDALVLGIRDYFHKTGAFSKAVIGLSGGIDSAVTCALAACALGPDSVVGVSMPSKYSSAGSVRDAQALAEALGIPLTTIPIKSLVRAYDNVLAESFADTVPGVAEENIQARARGTLLMALSNKFNYLLLSTGNKSEMSVGYATLYGDMNGGLCVLGDVLKGQVYRLAHYINRAGCIIPESTLTKPPSAELRPDQTDQDSLPPYDVLDEILRRYIEEQEDLRQITATTGFDRALVARTLQQVDRSEYKRRQAAPCLRVTPKAFGEGRRLPVVMRWQHASDSSRQ